jgi:hypothetical protein
MLILNCLRWWYGSGWSWRLRQHRQSFRILFEYFSVGALLRTLFAPYRQTLVSDGRQNNMSNLMNRIVDSLVSSGIGFVYRATLIVVAALIAVGEIVLFILTAVLWPFVPVLPIIAVVLALTQGGK